MLNGPNIDETYRQLLAPILVFACKRCPYSLIEQPTTFELIMKKRTANELGRSVPPSLLNVRRIDH